MSGIREKSLAVYVFHFLELMTESFSEYFLPVFTTSPEEIANTIYNIYLVTGSIYHNQYHCYPVINRTASYKSVCFSRGSAPGKKHYMSGAGEYDQCYDFCQEQSRHCFGELAGVSVETVGSQARRGSFGEYRLGISDSQPTFREFLQTPF